MPDKAKTIEANRNHATDTGSPEVQIAILTERINHLNDTSRCTKVTTTPVVACS